MANGLRSVQRTIEAFRRGNYSVEKDGPNRSEVMGYIHGYYKEAFDRLPSSLDPLVHEVGFCFGFFDPVFNIIANTAALGGSSSLVEKEAKREGKKRRRSEIGTSSKGKGKKASRGKEICADANVIAARSLKGLVTFLTTYLLYLPTSEALRYLRLARAISS